MRVETLHIRFGGEKIEEKKMIKNQHVSLSSVDVHWKTLELRNKY
jgi:hypothetical protein